MAGYQVYPPTQTERKLLARLGCTATISLSVNGTAAYVLLGEGSFGKVLQARHEGLDPPIVAVKIIQVKSRRQWTDAINELAVLARARHSKPAHLMHSVSREVCSHKGVVNPQSIRRKDSSTYITYAVLLPFVSGGTLLDYAALRERPHALTARYLLEVTTGLVNLAKLFPDQPRMRLHNDVSSRCAPNRLKRQIKPDNVLMGASGAVVADFGLVGIGSEIYAGTPGFICPWLSCCEKSDVFSLGHLGIVLACVTARTCDETDVRSRGDAQTLWRKHQQSIKLSQVKPADLCRYYATEIFPTMEEDLQKWRLPQALHDLLVSCIAPKPSAFERP